jgi:hypothetical protein
MNALQLNLLALGNKVFILLIHEAYAEAGWSGFKNLPAFEEGNRINAYQVYLSMEAELLGQ